MKLKDNVALITGAGRGIGKATAILFAREGAKIAIADWDDKLGEETVRELRDIGTEAMFIHVDVTNREQVQAMVSSVEAAYGQINILINNAGITHDSFLTKMSEDQWNRVIGVNMTGVFYVTQAVAPIMIRQGKGVILNASSVVGVYGNIGQTNYAATKAGVIGMTKSWAKELGRKGIRANAVAPGFIVTEMTAKVPQKVLDQMKEKTPIGRLGNPEDVAKAFLFLASDDSSYINGVVLSVDGGLVV